MGMGSMTLLPMIRVLDMDLHYMPSRDLAKDKEHRHKLVVDLYTCYISIRHRKSPNTGSMHLYSIRRR
jgi:hypothetical protein